MDARQFSSGFRLDTILGKTVTVQKFLGEGGQGTVYAVDYNGEPKALKWYKPDGMGKKPESFYDNLKKNALHGPPGPEFLWPQDLTGWRDGCFGYIMDLRPEGYHEISEFMLRRVSFPSYRTITDAALHIVSAYRILHNSGQSYQDLNDGNFFIEPTSGKVLICDNDNVAPNKTDTGILGKPRYMAPEIVLRKNTPDNMSDRFSMSVILFILICMAHPLEGRHSLVPALTPELQERLYGSEALFIMDPNDASNCPVPGVHDNVRQIWKYLPDYMRDIFTKAFSQKAFATPNARPTELEWINALTRFRSSVYKCRCGNEVFVQADGRQRCEKCGAAVVPPFSVVFTNYSMPAMNGGRVYRCQVGICNADKALEPVGAIVENRSHPGVFGLKNMSERLWEVSCGGRQTKVEPGHVTQLADGMSISINNDRVLIKQNKL